MVPFSELLRFSTNADKLLMVIGGIAAFCNGASFPLFNVIFGSMTDSFGADKDSAQKIVDTAVYNTM